ncbi:MAG: outer membrane protein assembly factor BamD [Arenicellaceae bacterium]|nr:outer membrane protein assembly factor BamD [Arenicellaceae bacterium]
MKTQNSILTKFVLICALPLILMACAGNDAASLRNADSWTDQQFYDNAKAALDDNDYRRAILLYQSLAGRFPYGRFAEQAQLELIYAHYKANNVEAAVSAADQFVNTNPTHINIDYAYYLKGLVSFDEERSMLERLTKGGDTHQQDIKPLKDSYLAFKEMIDRYPNSRYVADANQRMAYLLNELARYEVSVAQYYLSREAYVAALNRCRTVIEDYQQTAAVEDALGIMIATYTRMGMSDLAADSRMVLRENFPASEYLSQSDSDIANPGFFSRLLRRNRTPNLNQKVTSETLTNPADRQQETASTMGNQALIAAAPAENQTNSASMIDSTSQPADVGNRDGTETTTQNDTDNSAIKKAGFFQSIRNVFTKEDPSKPE